MSLLAFVDCPLEVDLVHHEVDRRIVWRQRSLLALAALQEAAVRIPANEKANLILFAQEKIREKENNCSIADFLMCQCV